MTVLKTVVRDIGALQVLVGGLMLVPLLVSLLYREWYSALSFLIAAGITALAGGAAYKLCDDAPEPKRHHAMVVAALGWFVTAAFGALPFIIAAHITPPAGTNDSSTAGGVVYAAMMNGRAPNAAVTNHPSAATTIA